MRRLNFLHKVLYFLILISSFLLLTSPALADEPEIAVAQLLTDTHGLPITETSSIDHGYGDWFEPWDYESVTLDSKFNDLTSKLYSMKLIGGTFKAALTIFDMVLNTPFIGEYIMLVALPVSIFLGFAYWLIKKRNYTPLMGPKSIDKYANPFNPNSKMYEHGKRYKGWQSYFKQRKKAKEE